MDETQALAFEQSLGLLLHVSANKLVRDPAPGPYLDWIAQYGPSLGEGVLPADMRGAAHAVDASRLMRLMGHMIYGALPLPQQHFQPKKLPLPGRNEPCLCGSLRKFKHCCETFAHQLPALEPELAMPRVLDAMGKAAWKTLPAQKVSPRLVDAAAGTFRDERRVKDAVALLEPWAAVPGRYPAAWADLLDLLGDLYAELGKPRKRKALAQSMIDRGEAAVQAKGWQRLCLMHTDAAREAEARQALANAQRLAPDDPALALLEMSMLLGFGDAARANERALFHIRRLGRINDDGRYNELIETLREMGERGQDFLEDVGLRHEPDLVRLDAWLAALPAAQPRLDLSHCSADNLGALTPLPKPAAALRRWESSFDLAPPSLVALQGGGDPWRGFERWMKLLEDQPLLGDSFEVLDALLLALEARRSAGSAAAARRLMARGLALWQPLREQFPQARCEWVVWPNRPALRVIAQHIAADPTPDAEHSFDWLSHLVQVLNPHDNHGFRWRLAAVLLRRGRFADALALSERFPDDMDQMKLARVLALWHSGQRGAATSLLADTLRGNPKLARVMRSERRPRPRDDAFVAVGSLQEAQLAYEEQFDLWQAPELRELLQGLGRSMPRAGAGVR